MKQYEYLPNMLGAIFIILVLIFLEILIAGFFYDAGLVFFQGDPRGYVIAVLANGIIISVMMSITGMKYRDLFHPSPNRVSSTLVLLTIPIISVIIGSVWWLSGLSDFVAAFFPRDTSSLEMLSRMMKSGVASFLVLVIAAPILEEMLFRGIILRGFLKHYSPLKAILLSALIFALVHQNIYQIPTAFAAGCFLGWLYYGSKSLWPGIFAHALRNAVSFLIYAMQVHINSNSYNNNILSLLVTAIGIFIIYRILWVPNKDFRK